MPQLTDTWISFPIQIICLALAPAVLYRLHRNLLPHQVLAPIWVSLVLEWLSITVIAMIMIIGFPVPAGPLVHGLFIGLTTTYFASAVFAGLAIWRVVGLLRYERSFRSSVGITNAVRLCLLLCVAFAASAVLSVPALTVHAREIMSTYFGTRLSSAQVTAWLAMSVQEFLRPVALLSQTYLIVRLLICAGAFRKGLITTSRAQCIGCGYNLTGLSDRCPECGLPMNSGVSTPPTQTASARPPAAPTPS